MPEQFKPGDVVVLKSGGPKMTVNSVGPSYSAGIRVWCDWFDGAKKILKNVSEQGIDAVIAIGGDDTLGVASKLCDMGLPVVGVPKTIDNDLVGTDYTFGFQTAVSIACEAIERLRTTAESHHRVMILEVMGRNSGWIALESGIAGGANAILIPEKPTKVADIVKLMDDNAKKG